MSVVAVTGASGFVGRQLVPALVSEGHEVRALTRREPHGPLIGRGITAIRGDVRSRETIRTLLQGAGIVVHLASSFDPTDDAAEIIVEGTDVVVGEAKEAGVGRVIFLSCLGANAANHSPFYAAKWRAEQRVRASDVSYVILLPSLILGPDDGVTVPAAEIIRRFPVIPLPDHADARMQPVDVMDVVRCIQLSLTSDDVANEEISIGGPLFVTYRNLIDLIQGRIGILKPKLSLPSAVLANLAPLYPSRARLLFAAPRLAQLQQMSAASPGIVQRTFGFQPRSIIPELPRYLQTVKLS